ncbi:hypothetical protein B0T21DRAFT_410828 [Apiosordaria backusii]|uniref:Uncharacterized protein n=1 Tax=Apiosordaria backusii TaxID=314023 RepID=A0AA40EEX8_9PEZI|nr:hypothetical protein B0T21DRAFT_410828 [Apiosordaria backusii]
MCLHDPNCWLWPGHRIAKKKATRPPRSRQSTRAYRTKLQDALLRSSTTNTLLKHVNDVVPRSLLNLDASDKLSNHPDLIRDILARSLVHDQHNSNKPQDQPIWQALLSILDSEFPQDTALEPIWTPDEFDILQKPGQLLQGQEKVLLHPIWQRSTDITSTRQLLADASISHAIATKATEVIEVLLKHDPDLAYAPEGQGYLSVLDRPYFNMPAIEQLRVLKKVDYRVGPGANFRVAFGFHPRDRSIPSRFRLDDKVEDFVK